MEAKIVAAQFSEGIALIGPNATLNNIRRKISGAVVFHFAGHSIQINSGAALIVASSDSHGNDKALLTIADLPLSYFHHLQLVVLSACSTGQAQRISLERFLYPFLQAGVPQIILTRWDINSPTALMFMDTFYRHLLAGENSRDSIRKASAALWQRESTSHPYYWAAYKLIGIA
jgi:CHAT domain-containing protein